MVEPSVMVVIFETFAAGAGTSVMVPIVVVEEQRNLKEKNEDVRPTPTRRLVVMEDIKDRMMEDWTKLAYWKGSLLYRYKYGYRFDAPTQ